MRLSVIVLGALALMGSVGAIAACSGDEPEIMADRRSAAGGSSLEEWLQMACPDRAELRVTDAVTGSVRAASCEALREEALADDALRAELIRVYEARAGETTAGSERVGEAPEGWSPLGVVCAIVLGSLDLAFNVGEAGCHNPRAENPTACEIVTTGGATALAILCAAL